MPITLPPDYQDFLALSAAVGSDPLLVQGAGGNTSLKHEGVMWIKASGAWLARAQQEDMFLAVEHNKEHQPAVLHAAAGLRPSIETTMHALLPQRIVAHVHAVAVIAVAIRKDAETVVANLLDDQSYVFVPYTKPGWPLTCAIRQAMQRQAPNIIVLGNHGLIVAGETVAEVTARLQEVVKRFEVPLRQAEILNLTASNGWRLPRDPQVHALAMQKDMAMKGALYPDHVVFLGRANDQSKFRIIENKGVLLAQDLSPAGEAMVECLAQVLRRVPEDAELNYLTAADEDALLNWDAEKHRQAL